MCNFIKTNFKCVCVFLILLVVIVRNWVFWVYLPPESDNECKSSTNFTVIPSELLKFSNETVRYSNVVWVEDETIRQRLCNKNCLEEDYCTEAASGSYKYDEGLNNVDCVSILSTNNSHTVYEIFCKLQKNLFKTSDIVKCKLLQDGYTNEISNMYNRNNYQCFIDESRKLKSKSFLICEVNCSKLNSNFTNIRRISDYLILVLAIILHIITLVIFLLVPRLQAGYGRSVMSYVFSQIMRKMAFIMIMAVQNGVLELKNLSIYSKFSNNILSRDVIYKFIFNFTLFISINTKCLYYLIYN